MHPSPLARPTTILDLDVEAHRLILEHLPPPAVASLGSTCRRLRDAAFGGPYGEALWRRLAVDAVGGPAAAALHAAAWEEGGLAAGLAADVGGGGLPGPGRASTPPVRQPPGRAPRAGALAWARLVAAVTPSLPAVHWSGAAAAALTGGAPPKACPDLAACTARSGHAAVATPSGRVLVTGGVRRDGGTGGGLDLVVVDALRAAAAAGSPSAAAAPFMATAVPVTRPPLGRFRHVAVLLDARLCPAAAAALADAGAPPTAADQAALGDALLVHGGADAAGREHGAGGVVEVGWVSRGAGGGGGGPSPGPPPVVVWATLHPGGPPPAPRYHHTADAYTTWDGRPAVVVFGGDGAGVGPEEEGDVPPDEKGGGVSGGGGRGAPAAPRPAAALGLPPPPDARPLPPVVHILDLRALAWRRRRTVAAAPPAPPGAGPSARPPRPPPPHPASRSLHLSTIRACPDTASPQLVITGGYAGGGLAPMTPWALDLTSLVWERGEGGGGGAAALPAPRQRAAAWRAAPDWLVMYGGSPAAGGFLGDVWGLHLPRLAWVGEGGGGGGGERPPTPPLVGPRVAGRPAGPRRVAGHTLAAGLALGGCVPTLVGVVPVAKCDVLLVGEERARPPPPPPPPPVAQPPPPPPAEQPPQESGLLPLLSARLRSAWARTVVAVRSSGSSLDGPATVPGRTPPAGGVLTGAAAEAARWTALDGDGLTPLGEDREDGRVGACAVQ